jgi:surfactin synthase thioesterase subunit
MKVLYFGLAGGSECSYIEFGKQFNTDQYHYMELPGNGKKMRRTPFVKFHEAIDYHVTNIETLIDKQEPAVLFEHSLGSLIACQVTHVLAKKGYNILGLVASGHSAPCKPNKHAHISTLNPSDFITEVDKIGGLPEAIKKEKRILAIFEPILRADFSIITDYNPPQNTPLNIPVIKIYGDIEGLEAPEIEAWQEETSQTLITTEFVENHFFIYEHWPAIAQLVKQFEVSAVGQ